MILNGGMPAISSLAGPGNAGKSEIAFYICATILGRYKNSHWHYYDTECSTTYGRIERLLARYPEFDDIDISEPNKRFIMVKSDQVMGDVWFDKIQKFLLGRIKDKKKHQVAMPFKTPSGGPLMGYQPLALLVDSLTEFKVSAVQTKLVDKNNVGDSGQNMVFMLDGKAKTIFMSQLPNIAARSGTQWLLVAHIGMKHELDPYAPKAPTLTHARAGRKAKGVPEKFSLINGHLVEISNSVVLKNSSKDTSAKYPLTATDREQDCKDLMAINSISTRNKTGPSGVGYQFLTTQSGGVDAALSEFNYLREHNENTAAWGMSGNVQNYHLDLLPEVTVSRTTVRKVIDENAKFRRALTLTTDLHQIISLWGGDQTKFDHTLIVPLSQLHTDLKEMGYDWDDLLNTRPYWLPVDEEEGELPYISIYDLFRMRAKLYVPYWHDK